MDGIDEEERHGEFSGASSPWYKMMMSSNEDEEISEGKKSVRKKKTIPKIEVNGDGNTNISSQIMISIL